MKSNTPPAWAKYVVLGYYEDEQEEDWPVQYFKDRESAEEFAYDYEAQHDGIIRAFVEEVKHKAPAKPAVKKAVVKPAKKPAVKKVHPNGYALMYLANAEDIEMGGDRNRWFTFKSNGQTVTHFTTLEGLLKAIMTQLKPSGKWHIAHIYKCSHGKNQKYGEITITPWDWETRDFSYADGRGIAKNTTYVAIDNNTSGTDWNWYAVSNSGKLTPLRFGIQSETKEQKVEPRVERKVKPKPKPKAERKVEHRVEHKAEPKTERKSRSMSPFDWIDKAFSEGKKMIKWR